MKKLLFLFLIICVSAMFFTSCSSTPSRQLYVIHIHGDWCTGCKSVDPVIHSLEGYFESKNGVEYVVFDETSPETVKKSGEIAEKLGLGELFEYERHTGEVLFVDKDTKEILTVLASVGNKDTYIEVTENLLNGKEVAGQPKAPTTYELSKPPVEKIKKASLYVIDIHHDKCGTCSVTVPTFEKVAEQYKDNEKVSFLTFDLSSPKTIDETRKLATDLDILNIYSVHKHTGEVIFVDSSTKEIKDSLVAETNVVKYHKIIDGILGGSGESIEEPVEKVEGT